VRHRVDDHLRLLRGVGRVEVHQRLAVELALQQRELSALMAATSSECGALIGTIS
jgi:Lhr-like helicase